MLFTDAKAMLASLMDPDELGFQQKFRQAN